jgi:hypothetical protein
MTKRFIAILGIVLGAAWSTLGQGIAKGADSIFREDDQRFLNGEQLPSSVLRALERRRETAYSREVHVNENRKPEQFFRVAKIQLCGGALDDYIMQGDFPLTGIDQGWFWVVHSIDNTPRVVLFAPGNSLELLEGREHGCREIRSSWESVNEKHLQVFRFDGRKYVRSDETWIEKHPN